MSKTSPKPKPVVLDYRFLGTTLLGAVTVGIVSVFGTVEGQLAMMGTWLSILAGLLVTQIQSAENANSSFKKLLNVAGLVPDLTKRGDLLRGYTQITQSLHRLSLHSDPVLVDFACRKLDVIAEEIEAMASGQISFASTESWRMTYEQILRRRGMQKYRSVAWFKSAEYWQDEPGRKSMQLNLELRANGLTIERIVIVRDELWAANSTLPAQPVVEWIDQQVRHGIRVSLLRESDLINEPELCRDMGIYDDRAVGIQELDDRCRTMRFTLNFEKSEVARALTYWESLSLYSKSFDELMGG